MRTGMIKPRPKPWLKDMDEPRFNNSQHRENANKVDPDDANGYPGASVAKHYEFMNVLF